MPQPILFYDGECLFCSRMVRFLLLWDRRGQLRFAALQSKFARGFLNGRGLSPDEFTSAVLVHDWSQRATLPIHLRSDAILEALKLCGGWASLLAQLIEWVPLGFRDWCYDRIAARRLTIAGRIGSCLLPKPEWRERFIID